MALLVLLSIPFIFLGVFTYLLSKLTKQQPKKFTQHFLFLSTLLTIGIISAPLVTALLNHLQKEAGTRLSELISAHYYLALLLSPIPLSVLLVGLTLIFFWKKPKLNKHK